LSENRAAALSEARPGDVALICNRGAYETATVDAVLEDSKGRPSFQIADGRVLPGTRLLGQIGASITVQEESTENAPDFDPGQAGDHLEMPTAARLFGMTLVENDRGYTCPCPFCQNETMAITPHRGMWLFECACRKQGDLMDLVGGLVLGEDWQPDRMSFDEMADIVLEAIHERLPDEEPA
jgi:hypothetical protein